MQMFSKVLLTCVFALACASATEAAIISNGQLSVNISNTDGSINALSLNNNEFYNTGVQTSNFGFQVGTTTTTFKINNNDNLGGNSLGAAVVTTPAGQVKVVGNYAPVAGTSIKYTRTYQILAGLNVLRTTFALINNSTGSRTITAFDTFDPDQGGTTNRTNVGAATAFTNNDVFSTVGQTVVQATKGRSVVLGGSNGIVGTATTSPAGITSGAALNTFITSPVDANGANFDRDISIAFRFTMAQNASTTLHFDQAFGNDATIALNQFNLANQSVPEPATMIMWGMGALALGYRAARRRKTA